ncbi:MAG: helix-turn-helix domain-containing protein, partial [Pseudonocardiaceae bacterium]
MTEEVNDQTAHRRRLAALLRDLRLGAGLTGEQLGARAGMSQSKV